MFRSFFPNPRLFFASVLAWSVIATAIWYAGGNGWGALVGLGVSPADAAPVIGLGHLVTPEFLWFYVYYGVAVALFAAVWFLAAPHPWQRWSILGSALILFVTYFGVQISVAINNWRRPFFDTVQEALGANSTVTQAHLVGLLLHFAQIAFVAIFVFVLTRFFVSHWIFRWRTAMNDYYMARWNRLRHIEGASQRVQEDTMRFAGVMEGLGVSAVDAVMTLIAFLPVLWALPSAGTRPPVVVVDEGKVEEAQRLLGGGYAVETIPLRSWWLPEVSLSPLRPNARELLVYLFTRRPWSPVGAQNVVVLRRPDGERPSR